MKVFLDTSALAKRYVAEQGSDQVLAVCQQADSLVVSVICLPELVSTLCRLVREEKLASAAYRTLKGKRLTRAYGCFFGLELPEKLDEDPMDGPYIETLYRWTKSRGYVDFISSY